MAPLGFLREAQRSALHDMRNIVQEAASNMLKEETRRAPVCTTRIHASSALMHDLNRRDPMPWRNKIPATWKSSSAASKA